MRQLLYDIPDYCRPNEGLTAQIIRYRKGRTGGDQRYLALTVDRSLKIDNGQLQHHPSETDGLFSAWMREPAITTWLYNNRLFIGSAGVPAKHALIYDIQQETWHVTSADDAAKWVQEQESPFMETHCV